MRGMLAAGRVLVWTALLAACAQAAPPERSASALYRDLQRVVTVRQARGWQIDRLEVKDLLGDALASVCRAPPEVRASTQGWLEQRIAALGGPPQAAWEARGRVLARVGDLIELDRVRQLLAAAVTAAPDDCPFWITPAQPFIGRQIIDDRFILVLEGGGKLIGLHTGDENDIAGGAAGRVLVGRGLGPRWALLTGAELGASGELRRDGGMGRSLLLAFDAVFPLVVRYRFVNSYLDIEPGYVLHFNEEDTTPRSGLYLGVAFGLTSVREGVFTPGIAVGVGLEHVLGDDTYPATTYLKVGLRITLAFDL